MQGTGVDVIVKLYEKIRKQSQEIIPENNLRFWFCFLKPPSLVEQQDSAVTEQCRNKCSAVTKVKPDERSHPLRPPSL